jgi:hypothetical protein
MRIPSNELGSVSSGESTLSQPGVVWGRSTERNTRCRQTEMSFCGPWQRTSARTTGVCGFEMSMTRNPS